MASNCNRRARLAGHRPLPLRARLAAWAAALLLAACATPAQRADRLAATAGWERIQVDGDPFMHVGYLAPGPRDAGVLWVYIEGDGIPWVNGTVPSADPTPARPMALEMMAKGPRPALYLGRPCYFGTARTPPCAPAAWTRRRYAPEIVRSMRAALAAIRSDRMPRGTRLALVGYSGGGVLATFLASQLSDACALVTFAAPLDVEAWTRAHGYEPLAESSSPVPLFPLRRDLLQLHIRGGADAEVAPDNAAAALGADPAARLEVIPGAGHGADWPAVWSAALASHADEFAASCR